MQERLVAMVVTISASAAITLMDLLLSRYIQFLFFIFSKTLPILSSLNLLILLALTIFILPQTKAESDGYRSIMYRIADK